MTINAAVTRQGFTPISNKFISRPDVDPFSKTILTYLASHSDSFTPSQRQICTATGISLATLKRRLRILEAAGLLIRIGHGIYNVIRYRVAGCLFDSSQRATSKLSVTHLRTTTQNNNNLYKGGRDRSHRSETDPPPDPPSPEKGNACQVNRTPAPAARETGQVSGPPRRKRTRQDRNTGARETAVFLSKKEKISDLFKPFFVKKNHRRLWSLIEHEWNKHYTMDELIELGGRLHDLADRREIKNPAGFMCRSISNFRGDWREFLGYLTDRAGS